jgi:hypothetical protein
MLRSFTIVFILLALSDFSRSAVASNHYTAKQMDALAARVGGEFWITPANGRLPVFLAAPAPNAATFRAADNESFEITELVGRAQKNPYYKVKFASGKVGYMKPDAFHEELNSTIATIDPTANEKRKAEELAVEDKKRVDWIQAQPWSSIVKQAAIKRQATPGLTGAEVKRVLGAPKRIAKKRGVTSVAEEGWFYPDGSILTFQNGLLTEIKRPAEK